VGGRIPDLDTEPQEPAVGLEGAPTLVDADLQAPRIPALQFTDRTTLEENATDDLLGGPTLDISKEPPEPIVFASWEESRDIFVGSTSSPTVTAVPAIPDESPVLRQKIQWITIALAASIAAQLGGFAGDRLLPPIVQNFRAEHVTYQRVWKSARSLEGARKLGAPVSGEIADLQREAEQAAFEGDAERARQKLDELDSLWRKRGPE
jgi:hypothetical protein